MRPTGVGRPLSVPDTLDAGAKTGAVLTILGEGGEESRSYEELVSTAFSAAVGLAERGVGRGDRVALFARTTFDFVVGAIAAWRAGATIVPLHFPPRLRAHASWKEQIATRVRQSSPALLLIGAGDPEAGVDCKQVKLADLPRDGRLSDEGPAPDDLALIQFTSGSTSSPRGVELTHRAVTAQTLILARRFFLGKREELPVPLVDDHEGLLWVPLYHDMGLFYLFTYMGYGRSFTLMPTARFLAEPEFWLTEISHRKITASSAPNFGLALAARSLERLRPGSIDLGGWQHVYSGGEPIDPTVVERFIGAAAPFGFTRERVLPAYGLAEAAASVAGCHPGEGFKVDEVDRKSLARGLAIPTGRSGEGAGFVGHGQPYPGVEVRIIDSHGEILPERSVGEIEVRSPSLMRGYLGDPDVTRAVLVDGWLRTGDRGYLVDGEVFVTGRIKDIVIIHGQNHHAEDIERVAQRVAGVRAGSCIAFGSIKDGEERLVVLAERSRDASSSDSEVVDGITAVVWREMGLRVEEVTLFPPQTLPKTSSGKLQRRLARELIESGALGRET